MALNLYMTVYDLTPSRFGPSRFGSMESESMESTCSTYDTKVRKLPTVVILLVELCEAWRA